MSLSLEAKKLRVAFSLCAILLAVLSGAKKRNPLFRSNVSEREPKKAFPNVKKKHERIARKQKKRVFSYISARFSTDENAIYPSPLFREKK